MDRVGVEPTTSAQQQLSKQGPCMHLLLSHPERFCRADVEIVPLLSIDHPRKCCPELGCSCTPIHHPLPSINDRFVLRRCSADYTKLYHKSQVVTKCFVFCYLAICNCIKMRCLI